MGVPDQGAGIRCRIANKLSRIDTDHYAVCHLVS
jgi:hypothetical protein